MDFQRYTDFENFALESINRLLEEEFKNSYPYYNKILSKNHRDTIAEIRENRIRYESQQNLLGQYFHDLRAKVLSLLNSLFRNSDGRVTYLLDDRIIDDSTDPANKCIRVLYNSIRELFNSIDDYYRSIMLANTTPQRIHTKHKGPRLPNRASFSLINPEVNFNAIRERLLEGSHPFIDPATSLDNLRRIFTGLSVDNTKTFNPDDLTGWDQIAKDLAEYNIKNLKKKKSPPGD